MTRVTRKGKVGDLSTRRGGGSGSTHEGKQHEAVGKAAKEAMKAPPGENWHPDALKGRGRNVIAEGERRMSISASKDREDPGGAAVTRGRTHKRNPHPFYDADDED